MTDAERLEAMGWSHVPTPSGVACDECAAPWPCDTAVALAEVERLRGVVERMREAYDQKVDDFAKETLRVDALLKAAHYDGGPHMVGEAGLGWNAAMKHVRAALAELEGKVCEHRYPPVNGQGFPVNQCLDCGAWK